MRTSVGSLAVTRDAAGRFLALWNAKWNAFSFVGGHRRPSESHRECLVREIHEELGLSHEIGEFLVGDRPIGRLEYEDFSASAGQRTWYEIELFALSLSTEARRRIDAMPEVAWLSPAEIDAGRCADGRAISATVRHHVMWMRLNQRPTPVYWLIAAQQKLDVGLSRSRPQSADTLRGEYDHIADRLRHVFPDAVALVVRNRYEGFAARARPHKLLVEVVTTTPGTDAVFHTSESYVVKVGEPELEAGEVSPLTEELEGWESCCLPGNADGMFSHLRGVRGPDRQLVGLVYQDAYHALGGGAVEPLEDAFLDACLYGQPSAESVMHVVRELFARMFQRYYSRYFVPDFDQHFWQAGKSPNRCDVRLAADGRRTLLRQRVERSIARFDERNAGPFPPSAHIGISVEERRRLRREALSLLSGGDEITFIDPHDYLTVVLANQSPPLVPRMMVGSSHGDLHGRNVLVSMLEDEAGAVAVFDYGDMHRANHIGWDFVKLEVELKLRALARILKRERKAFVRDVHAFERKLAELTERMHEDRPLGDIASGGEELDRLMLLVLEIRRQARRFLGQRVNRAGQWLEEYYFLLTCYGVYAARFPTYDQQLVLGAFVGAGTVARRLSWPWGNLAPQVAAARLAAQQKLDANLVDLTGVVAFDESQPAIGHHARLAFLRVWVHTDTHAHRPFVEEAVKRLRSLNHAYPHVLEITEVLLVGLLELGQHAEVEQTLARVSSSHVELSNEMLGRLGRLMKDRGTSRWPEDQPEMPQAARESFRAALNSYLAADPNHYYPAVNVAGLQFLLGDRDCHATARRVLELARRAATSDPWAQTTVADALFLMGEHEQAADEYRAALRGKPPQQARSILRQLRLLLRVADEERRQYWNAVRCCAVFDPAEVRGVFREWFADEQGG